MLAFFGYLSLLMAPAWAQNAVPPDGAQVLAGAEGVVFHWPTTAGQGPYVVQIYSEGASVLEKEVSGNRLAVPLQSGLAYNWQVSLRTSQGFQQVVTNREFQVTQSTEILQAGADGQPGQPGPDNTVEFNGQPGQPGPNLTVTLTQDGEYIGVFVTGGVAANQTYYLSPGAGPLLIAVPGGRGGNGLSGAPAYYYEDGTVEYQGSAGGNGGDGGAGGTVTVIANGLSVSRYVTFNTRGGAGGSAGAPGSPEAGAGSPGRPGRDGQVIVR